MSYSEYPPSPAPPYQAPYPQPQYPPPHGGGPYPRQDLPTVYPIVILTLLFGVFGVIMAATRAGKATRLGHSGARYWGAWVATMVFNVVAAAVLFLVVFAGLRMAAVENALVGQHTNSGDVVQSAKCTPTGDGAAGEARFWCTVTLRSGAEDSLTVQLNPDGTLVPG